MTKTSLAKEFFSSQEADQPPLTLESDMVNNNANIFWDSKSIQSLSLAYSFPFSLNLSRGRGIPNPEVAEVGLIHKFLYKQKISSVYSKVMLLFIAGCSSYCSMLLNLLT